MDPFLGRHYLGFAGQDKSQKASEQEDGSRKDWDYASALSFVQQDKSVRDEVGEIKGIFFVPFGGFSMSSGPEGSRGDADLHLIVKGSRKYIDLNLLMRKELNTNWEIEINQ